ncbi:MAG: hypothetical protein ACR2FH_09530 [Caulobacteraceae bacterium]
MKTVRLRGGLSNQLFGLAFAHSVGILSGAPVQLEVSGFDRDRHGRRFLLGALAARLGLAVGHRPISSHRLVAAAMAVAPWGPWVRERHPPPRLRGLREMARRGATFDGYWQNEAYMAEPAAIRRPIRAFLEARGGPALAHEVVIHCRSYAEEPRPDRREGPDAAFYRRAMAAIEARHGPTGDIGLVCDDPDLARERLGALGRRVTVLRGADAFADMTILLKARSLILANSSFSWWGGFCGEAETVIYPRRVGLFHYPIPAARFTVL